MFLFYIIMHLQSTMQHAGVLWVYDLLKQSCEETKLCTVLQKIKSTTIVVLYDAHLKFNIIS